MATSEERVVRKIDSYLEETVRSGGSDLHFMAGDPARIRVHGELRAMGGAELAQAHLTVRQGLRSMLSAAPLHHGR